MSGLPRVRPRFRVDDDRDADTVVEAILDAARHADDVVLLRTVGRHVELTVPPDARRFWSPCLSIDVEPVAEPPDGPAIAGHGHGQGHGDATAAPGGSSIRGLIGPRPDVWTMFAAGYATLAFVAVTAAMIGAAQLTLGAPAHALWWCPVSLALLGVLYAGAQIGQRLAGGQTEQLRGFLRGAVPGAQKERPAAQADGPE